MTKHQRNTKTPNNNNLDTTAYNQILGDIRSILQKGVSKAYKAVDNLKVQTYWQIGERIVRDELEHKGRADYGKQIIEKLAIDLEFSRATMFSIVAFYRTYPIVQTLSGQLSWSHYLEFIRIENKNERDFYELQTLSNIWSVRQLQKQIRNDLYGHSKEEGKVIVTQPIPQKPILPEDIFKDTYNFDFLTLDENQYYG